MRFYMIDNTQLQKEMSQVLYERGFQIGFGVLVLETREFENERVLDSVRIATRSRV